MIDVSQLPAVRAQLERDLEGLKQRHQVRAREHAEKSAPQFARAPTASGSEPAGVRQPVKQRGDR